MKIMEFMSQNTAFAEPKPTMPGLILKEMPGLLTGAVESSGVKK